MCHGAAIAKKTMALERGVELPDAVEDCARAAACECQMREETMRVGKTMPMRPLVRTLRAQAAANPQQRKRSG